MKSKPFIYPFKTRGGNYIYDVNTNKILSVSNDVYTLLNGVHKNGLESLESVSDMGIIDRLQESGYLGGYEIEEIKHPSLDILDLHLESHVNSITLQVTQSCNLRCDYCPFTNDSFTNRKHAPKFMKKEVAKKGIDFLIEHSTNTERIGVSFYGGEPLLCFDLIKDIVLYTEKEAEGKNLKFVFTTNGTLLTKEIMEFLVDHDIAITISLDGPRNIHDRSRKLPDSNKGSFDVIMEKVKMIETDFPSYIDKLSFNVVMDPSLPFSEYNDFFMNYAKYDIFSKAQVRGSFIDNRYSEEENSSTSYDFAKEWNHEFFKFFLTKFKKLKDVKVSKLLESTYASTETRIETLDSTQSGTLKTTHHSGPCIPGVAKLFMDVDGTFYPCEKVSESSKIMEIGHIDTGFNKKNIETILNVGKVSEDRCKKCWALRFCSICAICADGLDKLSDEIKVKECHNVKYSSTKDLITYCTLHELGYDFDKKSAITQINIK